MRSQPNNPLHGVTLKAMLTELVDFYGWEELGNRIAIRCFTHDPGLKSSLHFLRRTPWARSKVESLYLGLRGSPRNEKILYRPNVAALLVNAEGRVFIAERTDIAGAWQFPQGGIDEDESPEDALRRELMEEISLAPDRYLIRDRKAGYRYVFPGRCRKWHKFRGQEQTYFLCDFIGSDADICLATAMPEFRNYRWIRPDEFSLLWLPDFKRQVYRDVLQDFFQAPPTP